jgi:hypothetical protein
MKEAELSKIQVQSKIIIWQIAGLLIIIMTCWVTEIFDPPFSFQQVIIETVFIILFGCLSISLTWKLIRRLKYLEGFLVICSSCKQVRVDDAWVSIEHIISNGSDLQLSHGICPECAERLYGKYLRKGANVAK